MRMAVRIAASRWAMRRMRVSVWAVMEAMRERREAMFVSCGVTGEGFVSEGDFNFMVWPSAERERRGLSRDKWVRRIVMSTGLSFMSFVSPRAFAKVDSKS